MKNALTLIRSSNIKELKKIEKRLLCYAQCKGFKVVGNIQIPRNVLQNLTGGKIVKSINLLQSRNIELDAVITARYTQLHRSFSQTLSLIRFLSKYDIQIISIEETLDMDDPIFTEIYYPRPPSPW
jgi:DNA invertase Pin-like site-specific DNA recombinase